MSKIGDETLLGFVREIEKMAFSPRMSGVIGNAGALGGLGAVAGSLIGGGRAAYKGYQEAKDRGASTGGAVASGLAGAASGAGKGALIGAGTGALAGAGAGALLHPEKAEAMRQSLTSSGLWGTQFGQRQAHGLTGWMPGSSDQSVKQRLGQIGMGSSLREAGITSAQQELDKKVQQQVAHLQGQTVEPGFVGKLLGRGPSPVKAPKPSVFGRFQGKSAIEEATGNVEKAREAVRLAERSEERGLTSIPGYLRALREDVSPGGAGLLGSGGALRTSIRSELSGSPGNIALVAGIPMAFAAPELLPEEDPSGRHRSRMRRAASAAGLTTLGLATGGMPMTISGQIQNLAMKPGQIASERAKRRQQGTVMAPQAPDLTADSGQAVPSERVVSERAAGSLGEGSPT